MIKIRISLHLCMFMKNHFLNFSIFLKRNLSAKYFNTKYLNNLTMRKKHYTYLPDQLKSINIEIEQLQRHIETNCFFKVIHNCCRLLFLLFVLISLSTLSSIAYFLFLVNIVVKVLNGFQHDRFSQIVILKIL